MDYRIEVERERIALAQAVLQDKLAAFTARQTNCRLGAGPVLWLAATAGELGRPGVN